MKKALPYLFIALLVLVFFWQFFIKGLLPIPADTIVGLYHPFRDLYSKDYSNGIPFKNFLITDPVRQQYPWRELVISIGKKLELPLWNPYVFAGTPLLANFQSGSFYFFNTLFLLMPFSVAWSLIVFLGPLLGGIFLYFYLDNLKLSKWASVLGAITFSFSGFFVAWMEWGTMTHVALWLPLILLSIDKLISKNKNKTWSLAYLFSLVSSFFAGHLQIFFYLFVLSCVYFLARWLQNGRNMKVLGLFLVSFFFFLVLTAVQWIPTLQFILLSARSIDSLGINSSGWFIPWQHLIQFIAPDYFGNPATLNYWGTWNYGELIGYVGMLPLILAIFSMFYRKDKKTLFFGSVFFVSLILSLPTFVAKIPFLLHIPFVETSQPTRLLVLVDFSLAVLAALGFDYLLKTKRKTHIIYPLIFILAILIALWIFIPKEHLLVVRNNLILPTMLFAFSLISFCGILAFKDRKKLTIITCLIVLIVVSFDLLRFGWKFNAFTQKSYLYPTTQTISYLQKQKGQFRIATTDSRILPPNFSSIYRIESVDGYDPLYLRRYGELIAAIESNNPGINTTLGFNRIVAPRNYESRLMDLLGVKYLLSLSVLNSSKLTKVFQEGQTVIYENRNAMPRAFFVKKIKLSENSEESMKMLFDSSIDLTQTGIVENIEGGLSEDWSFGSVSIIKYSANKIDIDTDNNGSGFLVLTDAFYPTWKATVDGNPAKIYVTDYNFRGVVVPSGKHRIEFYNSLF
jgi:uncharacterized membrane protein YfhO